MSNNFTNAVRNQTKMKYTENGAVAMNTTGSKVLDLFSLAGGMRGRLNDVQDMFANAWNENPELAIKLAFYVRSIRKGMGERDVSYEMLKWVANNHPDTMRKNLKYLPEYGRWDDIYIFVGTPIEGDIWKLVKSQFKADIANYKAGKPVSLMAKWLPSVNTSSRKTVNLGHMTARHLGLKAYAYQKALSKLRKYINVTEVKMSARQWNNIDYQAVPSKAMTLYRHSFTKHDPEGFGEFMNGVKTGTKKINASTLYPYDLVGKYMSSRSIRSAWNSSYYNCQTNQNEIDEVVEAQWKALPNYIEGNNNVVIMADTSGSMSGKPIESALGLAIYFAERNHGAYHNLFMTFESNPHWIELGDNSLLGNVRKAVAAPWGGSTNLESAFRLILKTAVENHLSNDDLPKALIIISDFEFDPHSGSRSYGWGNSLNGANTYHAAMTKLYAKYGYTLPACVFWCVNSRQNTVHQNYNDKGVTAFSGSAASTFRDVLQTIGYNPYEAMLKVLMSANFAKITV